ncbi:hypothetical protein B5181_03505 [Streptomyces sp. 4F]|nr:hypothetical protein B5181_03505 [Streptomyces sp. 4F]
MRRAGLPASADVDTQVAVWGTDPGGRRSSINVHPFGYPSRSRRRTCGDGRLTRAEPPFADPRQYAEAGATRIPGSHPEEGAHR